MRYDVEVNGRRRQVNVHRADGRFIVHVDEQVWTVDVSRVNDQMLSLIFVDGGESHEVTFAADPGMGTTTVSTASPIPSGDRVPQSQRITALSPSMNLQAGVRRSNSRTAAASRAESSG